MVSGSEGSISRKGMYIHLVLGSGNLPASRARFTLKPLYSGMISSTDTRSKKTQSLLHRPFCEKLWSEQDELVMEQFFMAFFLAFQVFYHHESVQYLVAEVMIDLHLSSPI